MDEMPITREFINGRISFSVRTPKRKGITTLAVKIPLFYKEGRKSLITSGFFKKSSDIFFGATSHTKKSVNPLVSRVCGLFHINFFERSRCTKQHKTTCKNKKKVVKRLSEVFANKKEEAFNRGAIRKHEKTQ